MADLRGFQTSEVLQEFTGGAGIHEKVYLQGSTTMGRMKETPRYNVISLRISDDERELLNELSCKTCRSISSLMREAMRWELLSQSDTASAANDEHAKMGPVRVSS
jgi:predicted DNA-binding protein